ncbi:MAG: outer membrane protein [Pseudomonadota bacterium]
MRARTIVGLTMPIMLSLPGAALATDAVQLPLETPPSPAIIVQEATEDWSGVYVGGFASYNTGSADTSLGDIDVDGVEAGLFAGYDVQRDNYVFGGEADIAFGNVGGDLSGTDTELEKRINGSVRARAGIAVDRVLVFGTAGLAINGSRVSTSTDVDWETQLGWTAGGGADVKITESLFGRVEYRYTDYDTDSLSIGGPDALTDFDEHAVRAGVGVRF